LAEIKQALVQYRAVYMAAIGGAAALLSLHIKESEIVAYADLGAEAIRRLVVQDFPVIVVNDCYGGDAYNAGRARYARNPGGDDE
jgi:fumarate hydratase subunit beta